MSFQVFSDLHLEHCGKNIPQFTPKADNLILAGDIFTPDTIKKFIALLAYCTDKWQHIYYICGNHEFYDGGDMNILKLQYRSICSKFPNVHFLDNEYIIINGIAIYGFIGWTPLDKYIIRSGWEYLMDFQLIKILTSYMTPKMMVKISASDLEIFKSFIDKVNNDEILCESVLVISHFPPIREGTSDPKYRGNELQPYFSWKNIMEKIICPKLKVWVSGHSHFSYNFIINGIKYFSNQIGYPKEGVISGDGLFNIE